MAMSETDRVWSEEDVRKAMSLVAQRATVDHAFRNLCLANPSEALKIETGRCLPEGFVLRVIDNAGADLTVVLPDPAFSGELSETELEAVAGGGVEFLVGHVNRPVICLRGTL